MGGRDQSECLVAINRNRWSQSVGAPRAMIGTTRSRVSHFMNKFRKSGFIDYSGRIEHNGKIKVRQSLLNSLLHDKPQIREDEPA
jgi:hypothetical protein